MSIQKITLATALLLSITACSSGGKGGTVDDTARQENTKLQAQVKNLELKAEQAQKQLEQAVNSNNKNTKELEALKQEAANAKKDAEKAKQELQTQLSALQTKADNAQKQADLASKQLEQAVNSNNKNAEELDALKQEAANSKKEAEKAKQELQTQLSALQTKADNAQKQADLASKQLEQAVNSNNKNAKELEALKQEAVNAKNEAEKAKQDLVNALENFDKRVVEAVKHAEKSEREKRNQLFDIARNSGLPEYEAERVAELYTDLDEKAFTEKLKAREVKRKELIEKANQQGLQDWEVNNFINSVLDRDPEEADSELARIKTEKMKQEQEQRERENTRQAVIELAIQYGLQNWEANSFAYSFTDIDKAKEELEKRKQEKIERDNKYKALVELAESKGLKSNLAENFANANIAQDEQKVAENLDKEIANAAQMAKFYNLTIVVPDGFTGKMNEVIVPVRDYYGFDTGETKLVSYEDLYNQKYSKIVGEYSAPSYYYNTRHAGLETLEKNLPIEGTATYEGVAFTYERQGKLNYTVNFGTKEGQGTITEMPDIGTLTLEKGNIRPRYTESQGGHYTNYNRMAIAGNVIAETWKENNVTGSYLLDFYGPQAEEIAGKVELSGEYNDAEFNKLKSSESSTERLKIGFGGTRGEIKK